MAHFDTDDPSTGGHRPPSLRDWPLLRDLLTRSLGGRPCPELAAAVAEEGNTARALKQRWADLQGPGRCVILSSGTDGLHDGLVAAYLDGDGDRPYAIVRHLLTVVADGGADDPAHTLLGEIEDWAASHRATQVLLEVSEGDAVLADLLCGRGYVPTGVTRPGMDSVLLTAHPAAGGVVHEWARTVGRGVLGGRPVLSVAS